MSPARIVTGEYNAQGYTVLLCLPDSVCAVYSAGNHPQDSQAHTTIGLDLGRIRGFCVNTCREIAGERRAQYGGVTRIPEEGNS